MLCFERGRGENHCKYLSWLKLLHIKFSVGKETLQLPTSVRLSESKTTKQLKINHFTITTTHITIHTITYNIISNTTIPPQLVMPPLTPQPAEVSSTLASLAPLSLFYVFEISAFLLVLRLFWVMYCKQTDRIQTNPIDSSNCRPCIQM